MVVITLFSVLALFIGGGPPPEVAGLGLNPIYVRVLDLAGTVAAVGNRVPNPLQVLYK